MNLILDVYQDDLLRIGETIPDARQKQHFLTTIVNNATYQLRTPDGRVALRLRGDDRETVMKFRDAAGLKHNMVSWDPVMGGTQAG